MQAKFVDREVELRELQALWSSESPGLLVVYGRRRVGKTRLLLQWLQGKPHIYYMALMASHEVNLARLAQQIERQLGLEGFSKPTYPSLDSLLEAFKNLVGKRRLALVLDEFTYWVRSEPKVLSELQLFVDHVLPQTNILLTICGSIVGLMHREILGGGSPLYGRRIASLHVKPLKPWHLKEFLPRYSKEDRIRVYSLVGGIPYYLQLFKPQLPLRDNILSLFISKLAPLRNEVEILLHEEFRDPHVYLSILSSIVKGANTPSKIADYTGIHRQHLSKYLKVLEELGIVRRVIPLWSKRGYYRISDPLTRTWFHLIEPILEVLEAEDYESALSYVLSNLDHHASQTFEEVARQYLMQLRAQGKLKFTELGKFIHKGVEIDLVAIDHSSKIAHLFEVKWKALKPRDVKSITTQLARKATYLPLRDYSFTYHIIAREARLPAHQPDLQLHTIREMPL